MKRIFTIFMAACLLTGCAGKSDVQEATAPEQIPQETVAVVAENTPENYGLNVQVVGSGIQYKPAKVFNTEWAGSGLTANDDCTAISREG